MTSADQYKKYEELLANSQAFNPAKFQQGFERDFGEATNYNKDLIDQRANVVGQMQSLPAQMRQQYAQSAIRNPLEQEALIAQRRGTQTADLNRLTDFLGARGSRYEDVLRSHLLGYQTDAQMAREAAESQWRTYQDMVQQEQFQQQMAARNTGGTGGSGGIGDVIKAWLDSVNDQGQQQDARSPQQKVMDAINEVKQLRQTKNIEDTMNSQHKRLMDEASKMGLRLDPSALWVWLGNTNKQGPFTPVLFK